MKIVCVTWLDTNENSVGGWITKGNTAAFEAIKDDLEKSKACSIDSLGWLYKETDDLVVILADKDTHNEDDLFGRSQVIPKGIIKDIKYLD